MLAAAKHENDLSFSHRRMQLSLRRSYCLSCHYAQTCMKYCFKLSTDDPLLLYLGLHAESGLLGVPLRYHLVNQGVGTVLVLV